MISEKILEKYNFPSLNDFKTFVVYGSEKKILNDYYVEFLKATDYIASKLAEGVATKEEYAEELKAREFARSEIRRLEMM